MKKYLLIFLFIPSVALASGTWTCTNNVIGTDNTCTQIDPIDINIIHIEGQDIVAQEGVAVVGSSNHSAELVRTGAGNADWGDPTFTNVNIQSINGNLIGDAASLPVYLFGSESYSNPGNPTKGLGFDEDNPLFTNLSASSSTYEGVTYNDWLFVMSIFLFIGSYSLWPRIFKPVIDLYKRT